MLRSPQGPLVEIEGRGEVLCLCSNDYLGLANHPAVVEAGVEALGSYGAGTASVRFICGKFEPQVALERDLADFLRTEAALTYVSCWNANAALLDALCDRAHRRSSPTGSTTPRSSTACGSRGPATRPSTSTPTSPRPAAGAGRGAGARPRC